jgi:hypothetical protein
MFVWKKKSLCSWQRVSSVESLPTKREALNPNPSTTQNKKFVCLLFGGRTMLGEGFKW